MADVSILGAGFINYYSHVICRTRSGRLYAGGSAINLAYWMPAWTYSDDNGSTWAAINTNLNGSYYANARPTWGFSASADYTGVCMAVDGGDNVHCAWRDGTNNYIYYSRLDGGATAWNTPVFIGYTTATPNPPKVVVDSNNYVTVFYTGGTEATEETGWAVTSLDSGRTWKARAYTQNAAASLAIAGPIGACADNAGLCHIVYAHTDGTRVLIRHSSYDASTQTFSANYDTVSDAGYRAIEPDIACAVDGEMHAAYCGRKLGDSGFLNAYYSKYPVGGPNWQPSTLSTEAVADVRQAAIACWYNPGITDYVICGYRRWYAAVSQFEIQGTYANGPNHTSWSAFTVYSNSAIANNKAYPGFVYQRFPYIHDVPISGMGLSYYVETNVDFRYTSWEGVLASSTPATWNAWHPISGFIEPKV